MRARNIKPGYFKSDELAELPALTRILFAGLWCVADRAGRMEDRPKRIKADVLPYDDCDVDAMLGELSGAGFILRYETASGRFIQVTNFDKHQNPHKNEAASSIEAPEQYGTSTVQAPESHTTNRADSLIPDSLIPDSVNGSVSHETAQPRIVAQEKPKRITESVPFLVWSAGCDIAGVSIQDAADTKDRQTGKIKQLLRRYSRDDLIACFAWLHDDQFEKRRGIDWFRVEQRIDSYIGAGRPPPLQQQQADSLPEGLMTSGWYKHGR